MNPTRRLNGGFVTYDLPNSPAGAELERPRYMSEDETQNAGWIIEQFAGHTRPSKTNPEGRCRWVSGPQRPVDLDAALPEMARRQKAAREQWEGNPNTPPRFRIRNLYTGDVVLGDLQVLESRDGEWHDASDEARDVRRSTAVAVPDRTAA